MKIDSSGFVGVGTNNPAAQLHLENPTDNTTLFCNKTGINASAIFVKNSVSSGTANIFATNNGSGSTIESYATGTGEAGYFDGGATGYAIVANGLVGIGTATPAYALDVLARGVAIGDHVNTSAILWRYSATDSVIESAGSGYFSTLFQTSSNGLWINNGSNDIEPTADNLTACGNPLFRWSTIYCGNGVIQTSDARMKKNIQPLSMGLQEVLKLNPVSYEWKSAKDGVGSNIGFIAQDVEKIIPQAVVHSQVTEEEIANAKANHKPVPAITDPYGMKYTEIIPVLVKAVQEQQAEIVSLKNQLEELKKK